MTDIYLAIMKVGINPLLLIAWVAYFMRLTVAVRRQKRLPMGFVTMYLALWVFTLMPQVVEQRLNATFFNGQSVAIYIESLVMFGACLSYTIQIRQSHPVPKAIYIILIGAGIAVFFAHGATTTTFRANLRMLRNAAVLVAVVWVFIPYHLYRLKNSKKVFGERVRNISMLILWGIIVLMAADAYLTEALRGTHPQTLPPAQVVLYWLRPVVLFLLTIVALAVLIFNIMTGHVISPLWQLELWWRHRKLQALWLYLRNQSDKFQNYALPDGNLEKRLYDMVLQIMDMQRSLGTGTSLLQQIETAMQHPEYDDMVKALVKIEVAA